MEENDIIKESNAMEEPYEWPIDNTGLFTNVFNLIGRISQIEFLLVVLIGFGVLLILPFLIFIWRLAFLAESIKRLHDFGFSGYWCIPAFIAAIVMLFFSGVPWITGCCIVIFWLHVIILLLIPGTRGINKYGTNPLRSYREQTLEAGFPDI